MNPINDLNTGSNGNGAQTYGLGCTAVGIGCKAILCYAGGIFVTQPVASTLLVAAAKTISVIVDA